MMEIKFKKPAKTKQEQIIKNIPTLIKKNGILTKEIKNLLQTKEEAEI